MLKEKELVGDDLIKFIFSSESLSKKGNIYDDGSFTLLSDVEILNLMKKNIANKSVLEFFARNERKSPVWKSHEEFMFCLGSNLDKAKELSTYIAPLISYLNDVEDLSNTKQLDDDLYDEIQSNEDLEGKEEIIRILDIIKNYRLSDGTDPGFNYVILPARSSFFAKMDSKNLYIRFNDSVDGFTTYDTFEENQNDTKKQGYEFFYFYSKVKLDANHFLNYLYSEAHKNTTVRM